MNAVRQHQAGLIVDPFKNEGEETQLISICKSLEDLPEGSGVTCSQVGGQLHTREKNPGSTALDFDNQVFEVSAENGYRIPPQAVIGAQFYNDDLGLPAQHEGIDPRQSTCGGLAADAFIDHTMGVVLLR